MEPSGFARVDKGRKINGKHAMRRVIVQGWRLRGALAAMLIAGAASAQEPMPAADPGTIDEGATAPLCCGVPPADETTADQVFGRWVVSKAGAGAPLRQGERVEFRPDGFLSTASGACRFAVLRAELTVTCADATQSGDVRFEDDTKLIWRHDGKEMIFVAPTD
jgi:hypothetical protein